VYFNNLAGTETPPEGRSLPLKPNGMHQGGSASESSHCSYGFQSVYARVFDSESLRSAQKGNEIQRCWRLYEILCCASNGPDLLIRHASIISYS
jgi:hypothetical protein